jgi:protein TonB
MTAVDTWNEPFLPWVESENDRRFKRILRITIAIFFIFGIVVPFLPLPEVERKELKDVSPRLAQLILEKKPIPVEPPAPKPKAVNKEEKKETPVEKKITPKKELEPKQISARKVAETTGLIALSDDLADLRDSFDLASLNNTPQQKIGEKANKTTASSILTARATTGSGGINTDKLSRSTGGGELTSRTTSKVSSSIGNTSGTQAVRDGTGRSAMRSEGEIELVFQKNKGAIFSIYNRALRKDPTLQGKVVLELTISPGGQVIKCQIVSSELNDPTLERKLVSRVTLFKFAAKEVSEVTITYPIDFLPS